ncbi:MAG TPA: LPS assembly lipoprotein LptE [Longimicrobiales bacterium]
MSSRSPRKPGRRARPERYLLAALLLFGCNYGLRGGGGFPADIDTIYIAPFENQTVRFELGQEIFSELMEQLPRSLGVRLAGEEVADAIVRGTITRYEDVAEGYRDDPAGRALEVAQQQVTVTVSVQVIDTRRNVILWESSSLTGQGQYSPTSQSETDGRAEAVVDLVQRIIDGAQSQW